MRAIYALLFWLALAAVALPQSSSYDPNAGGGAGITSLTGDVTATGPGAATASALLPGGYAATKWYMPAGITTSTTGGVAVTASRVYCALGAVGKKLTISSLGAVVSTAATGGNLQLAVYTNANGLPATLVTSTASISTASAAAVSATLATAVQVGPGTSAGRELWFCSNSDNATAAYVPVSVAGGAGPMTTGSASLSLTVSTASQIAGLYVNQTFGTWPASFSGTSWLDGVTRTIAAPAFLVSSVP